MRVAVRLFFAAVSFAATGAAAQAGVEAEDVIAMARAYIGPEDKLDAVHSLVVVGTEVPAGDGPDVRYTAHLMRPLYQRVEQDDGQTLTVMTVDPFEGWVMRQRHGQPLSSAMIAPMEPATYAEMRVNTIMNLYFFRGHEKFRGSVEYLGKRDVEGEPAHVLEYRFGRRGRIVRAVHAETGRLLTTEMDGGVMLRERGEQRVDGLRFPTEIESYINGELAGRITLEQIRVNPEIDEAIFDYPSNL
ncbi:MAG: hypothetical protein JJU00_10425 [Opitutales bacterium]|nr:hypothetical protein [Opitutales bacterium]